MTSTPVLTDPTEAARVLSSGGIVAVPTETVYGLGALVSEESAIARVYAAKGRPTNHPLIVHVASTEQAAEYGFMNDHALALATAHWPGPLTVLVERSPLVPDIVTGGRDTVAIRMPDHPLTLETIRRCGPIVAPSANLFGHVSPTTVEHVLADLDGRIDAVLDGGTCTVGVESTIVDCVDALQILRPGAVSASDVFAATGRHPTTPAGESRAPGMLVSHYAPHARVHLVESAPGSPDTPVPPAATARLIGHGLDVRRYAADLYSLLRQCDADGVQDIFAVMPSGDGLAAAIRDRLRKAAADTDRRD